MKIDRKSIFGMAAVLTLAIAAVAFAHGGYRSHMGGYGGYMMGQGCGGGPMMGPGYGGHMMGYGSDGGPYLRGDGAWGGLSNEEAAKLGASREKFYRQTRELRGEIDEKGLALRNEMSRDNPDQDKIFALQKEISILQSDFDQKALAHQLEVRELLPQNYRGSDYGRGYCQ